MEYYLLPDDIRFCYVHCIIRNRGKSNTEPISDNIPLSLDTIVMPSFNEIYGNAGLTGADFSSTSAIYTFQKLRYCFQPSPRNSITQKERVEDGKSWGNSLKSFEPLSDS